MKPLSCATEKRSSTAVTRRYRQDRCAKSQRNNASPPQQPPPNRAGQGRPRPRHEALDDGRRPIKPRVGNADGTLGRDFWGDLLNGFTVCLSGDLGAGKTVFSRGFLRAASGDARMRVTSPTYLLDNAYDSRDGLPGDLVVHHMDLVGSRATWATLDRAGSGPDARGVLLFGRVAGPAGEGTRGRVRGRDRLGRRMSARDGRRFCFGWRPPARRAATAELLRERAASLGPADDGAARPLLLLSMAWGSFVLRRRLCVVGKNKLSPRYGTGFPRTFFSFTERERKQARAVTRRGSSQCAFSKLAIEN